MDSKSKFEIIDRLREDKKLSAKKLCELAGVSHNVLHTWQKRNTMPNVETLEALCDVLNYPLSQLFSDVKIEDLTEEQKQLLEDWSTLPQHHKKLIQDTIRTLKEVQVKN